MSRQTWKRWWKSRGGKTYAEVRIPLLTPAIRRERVEWAHAWQQRTARRKFRTAHLDEKWFWLTRGSRVRVKTLPRQASEEPKRRPDGRKVGVRRRRPVRHKSHAVKVMCCQRVKIGKQRSANVSIS